MPIACKKWIMRLQDPSELVLLQSKGISQIIYLGRIAPPIRTDDHAAV